MSVCETNDFRPEGEVRLPVDQNQIAILVGIDFISLNRDIGLAFANDADSSVLGLEPPAAIRLQSANAADLVAGATMRLMRWAALWPAKAAYWRVRAIKGNNSGVSGGPEIKNSSSGCIQ
jgi:hypothetical protein